MLAQIKKAFVNLFKTPQTHEYPKESIEKAKNFRGLIAYNEEECIFCLKCEKVCPPEAILFTPVDEAKKRVKNQKLYNYNAYLCIYCGECVRACPKPDLALWQTDKKPKVGLISDNINQNWQKIKALK
jgi:NADH-quinone oxidoreductase subunit I